MNEIAEGSLAEMSAAFVADLLLSAGLGFITMLPGLRLIC